MKFVGGWKKPLHIAAVKDNPLFVADKLTLNASKN